MTQDRRRAELLRLIEGAKALGFRDDVDHWTEELKELEEKDHG